MSGPTVSSMHDARDAEDTRLLGAGEVTLLVESYYGVILDRCRARVRHEDAAIGVAAEVAIRLLSELKRGRRYRVPFRVVVHKVIGWKIQEHFEPRKLKEVELEEWLREASTESSSELAGDAGFDALLEGLTELEQDVLRLRYRDDLDFQEIAARLGKEPNAVHQIHHRALTKLRTESP
jgi:RNA polymerase sigma factor (sigma-70 family)